mgnify:FL=1
MSKKLVFCTLFVLILLSNQLQAGVSWRACERQGDRLMRAKKYQEAVDNYIRAIVLGPKPPPQRLWRKHANAYANTPAGIKEQQTMKRSGGKILPPWEQKAKFTETFVRKDQYSPTEKIKTDEKHTLASAARRSERPESARIVAPEYEITGVTISRPSTGKLTVTGQVTNKSEYTIHNPRVYVTLYDHVGNLRGRNWGYIRGGRNTLRRGSSKEFQVKFIGFHGTVGYFKAEMMARFKRKGIG